MTKPLRLSGVMRDALKRALADPGRSVIRFDGGFWAPPGTPLHRGGGLIGVPIWWCDYRTIRALQTRGLLARMKTGTFVVTPLGAEAIAAVPEVS